MLNLDWPALQNGSVSPGKVIRAERAISGKVHGTVGFRWIARSPGFEGAALRVDRALLLSLEDAPASMPAWRFFKGHYYAVWAYRSSASDAAGRSNFLEKQILEWKPVPGIPPVAAALVLLNRASQLTEDDWINAAADPAWNEKDHFLEIEPIEEQLQSESLSKLIEAGSTELSALPAPAIEAFYAALRLGIKPAPLPHDRKPLSPLALACLLLPLSSQTADRLSLAGWTPSTVVDPGDGERWDGTARLDKQPAIDHISEADRCRAEAIRTFTPALASRPLPSVERLLQFASGNQRWLPADQLPKRGGDLTPFEERWLRDAVRRICRDASADTQLPAHLADARTRHLLFKAAVLEAACARLFNLKPTVSRVEEVLQMWSRA
ncbi:MAG: hypothetical protein JNK87_24160 [Bryobacterales bacterium]|nr:hypothetical protein [Bryobacterales bacterium]